MVNKKAQDLSIRTLILIVLGIVVLVLLILGFSIGWGNLWEKINIFGGGSSIGTVVTACKLAHTSQDTYTLCEKKWDIKEDGKKILGYNCEAAEKANLLDFEFSCEGIGLDEVDESCKGSATCEAIQVEATCTSTNGCTWS
jgi:hypothetical protein